MLSGFDKDLLIDVGFDDLELGEIFKDKTGLTDPDDVPETPAEAKTKTGELWLLGNHRLLCGDATKIKDVEWLMDGKKADIVFTDPPYGINIVKVGGGGKTKLGKVGGAKWVKANYYRPIQNDDKEFDPTFLLEKAEKIILFGGNYFASKLPNSGCWYCWDKTGDKYIQNDFADCEFIWTNLDRPSRVFRILWRGLLKQKGEDFRKHLHPTQKPIALILDILSDIEAEIVADFFGGSGSTLIACEKLNRHCYMSELDPLYIDVILERWAKFTGKDPVREDGVRWSELNQ